MLCLLLLAAAPLTAQPDTDAAEAERNYQRFLTIYRQADVSPAELEGAMAFVEAAALLAPETYKYLFSLGAANVALARWQAAIDWYDRARPLATDNAMADVINDEINFCRTKLAQARIADRSQTTSMEISFVMKEGTVEMSAETIASLPSVLPDSPLDEGAGVLIEALESELRDIALLLGVDLRTLDRAPFLMVGFEGREALERHFERGVAPFYEVFVNTYFEPPERRVTLLISSHPHELVDATRGLYPDMSIPVYAPFLGYFNPADDLIMATGGQAGYGTVLHEMIHALMAQDHPDAPPWLNEGLASVYERTAWREGRLRPLPNWRFDRMESGDFGDLATVAAEAERTGLHSSRVTEVRMLMLFLESRGFLDDLYTRNRDSGGAFDLATAIEEFALEETAWRAFVERTLLEYRAETMAEHGRLTNPDEVRFVQRALNRLVGAEMKVDGFWGGETQAALETFQTRAGLVVDGVPGPKTLSALRARYAKAQVLGTTGPSR